MVREEIIRKELSEVRQDLHKKNVIMIAPANIQGSIDILFCRYCVNDMIRSLGMYLVIHFKRSPEISYTKVICPPNKEYLKWNSKK